MPQYGCLIVFCVCLCLLCSWLLPIRTNGVHLSHISSGTKRGRRPRTFSITGWQSGHTRTHTNIHIHKINKQTKNRPHTFMYTCTFVNGGWTSLSVDSYRTTSNSKSKPHISPSSCTVYHTAFPFCSATHCFSFRLNTFKTMITKLSLWVKNSRILR